MELTVLFRVNTRFLCLLNPNLDSLFIGGDFPLPADSFLANWNWFSFSAITIEFLYSS